MPLIMPESQPNFPKEDLTESNAELFKFLLADLSEVLEHHVVAERSSFLYRLGHPSLVSTVATIISDTDRIKAYEYGIETYESIASLATLRFNRPGHGEIEMSQYFSVPQRLMDMTALLEEKTEQFITNMHNTQAVIESVAESAYRTSSSLARYAITGAAMAYALEIDVTDRPDVMLMRAMDE
ncbi:MAG TPA: hypothetical protein VF281_04745 [Candidatus Saccharimonadales bacterium]